MNWFVKLATRRREKELEPIALQIAQSCLDPVWQRVRQRIGTLIGAEVAGYVRARAAMIIDRHVDQAIAQIDRLLPTDKPRLTELATDAILHLTDVRLRLLRSQLRRQQRIA